MTEAERILTETIVAPSDLTEVSDSDLMSLRHSCEYAVEDIMREENRRRELEYRKR